MYKLFMILCVLVEGEVKCTGYDDSTAKIYEDLANCERDAEFRFYGMTDIFSLYGQEYEKIVVGCDEADQNS
jgi:hypothetical protein|tara:strand:- start:512 stop:727 length:216 start_codon:yes stop_codon:yes gene_type:complete